MSASRANPLQVFASHVPESPVPGVGFRVELTDRASGTITIQRGDIAVDLRAAGLSLPYPSGLARLRASDPTVELIVVDHAPPGLRRAAEDAGLSYLDLEGRGLVTTPQFVYAVEPQGGRPKQRRTSPFAPNASRVVRALLTAPTHSWTVTEVAALGALNPGTVHRVLAALVDLGLVERDIQDYVVPDPAALLDAWTDQAVRSTQHVSVPLKGSLDETLRALIQFLGGEAVVSGEVAAELLAPHLPAESALVHVLSAEAFAALTSELPPPAPVTMSTPLMAAPADPGYGHFSQEIGGLPIASPQQVYVDLARGVGRGREAAEHLRAVALGF